MSQKTAARASRANKSWAQVVKSRPHRVRSDVRMQPAQTTWCITMRVVVLPTPPPPPPASHQLWAAPDRVVASETLLSPSDIDSHLAAVRHTDKSLSTDGATLASSSSSSFRDVDEDEDDNCRLELLHSSISGLEREEERAGRESIPSSEPGSTGRTQSVSCTTMGDGLAVVMASWTVKAVDMVV